MRIISLVLILCVSTFLNAQDCSNGRCQVPGVRIQENHNYYHQGNHYQNCAGGSCGVNQQNNYQQSGNSCGQVQGHFRPVRAVVGRIFFRRCK